MRLNIDTRSGAKDDIGRKLDHDQKRLSEDAAHRLIARAIELDAASSEEVSCRPTP
jgi:hypothetical protein